MKSGVDDLSLERKPLKSILNFNVKSKEGNVCRDGKEVKGMLFIIKERINYKLKDFIFIFYFLYKIIKI